MKPIYFCLLSLIYLILLAPSCKKESQDDKTVVTGAITEKGSNLPISGATVFLGKKKSDSFMGYQFETVSVVQADLNGKFNIEYNEEPGFSYALKIKNHPNHYESEYLHPEKGQKNLLSINLTPVSYIRYRLKNISGSDQISLGYPCYFTCSYYGNSVDTTSLVIPTEGNTEIEFKWLVYKYNIDTILHSTILYIPPGDTLDYIINY